MNICLLFRAPSHAHTVHSVPQGDGGLEEQSEDLIRARRSSIHRRLSSESHFLLSFVFATLDTRRLFFFAVRAHVATLLRAASSLRITVTVIRHVIPSALSIDTAPQAALFFICAFFRKACICFTRCVCVRGLWSLALLVVCAIRWRASCNCAALIRIECSGDTANSVERCFASFATLAT